jgi:hypothetical protein
MDRPNNEPDKSPLTQDDQPNAGAVDGPQESGNPGRPQSQPQGSESETRGNSRGR